MKKAIALTLLLVVITAVCSGAESQDCLQSFELGWEDASELHRSGGWFLLGAFGAYTALGVYSLVEAELYERSGYQDSRAGILPFVCCIAVLAVPVIPARLLPGPAKILPPAVASDPECYREGYLKRAHQKNTLSLLYGELTAGGVILLGGLLVAAAVYGAY